MRDTTGGEGDVKEAGVEYLPKPTWQERRSLAAKVSDTAISNGDEANAAIEAELKRRG